MNWLNIETAILDSEEFVGSEPVARATWLCLLRYCCGQENGGTIAGCKAWSDRKWQQLARVTKAEVETDSALWTWEGQNLTLWAYPTDKEAEVQHRRERARTNGLLGGRPTLNQPLTEQEPTSETNQEPTSVRFAKAEGEEKEKEKEKRREYTPQSPPRGAGEGGETEKPTPSAQVKTDTQRRAEKLFRRRDTTPWGSAELKAWKANRGAIEATTETGWAALEAFYAYKPAEHEVVYRRQDLATLLNNWTGEIDKAHAFRANGPSLRAGAPYVANRAQARAEEALMPPVYDLDGNPAEF